MNTASVSQTLRLVRYFSVAAIVVLAVFFAVQMVMQKPPAPPNANIGGPFTLTSSNGEQVSEADFLGKPMLVYFGYTFCPDVCPYSLQLMASALDMLGEDKARFTPVFISVDPARDTPESLATYITSPSFPDGLVGLSGTPQETKAVASAYAVYFKKVGDGDDYIMDHTSAIFLMDARGRYVAVFTHSSSAQAIATCLRRHLAAKRC